MTVEHEKELQKLRRIGRVVGRCLRFLQSKVAPGVTTAELDALGLDYLERHGARSAPRLAYDFPGATCISINEEVAHGVPGERRLAPGDLVHIDVSAELDGYYGDTGASSVVGKPTELQSRLCAATQRALRAAMAKTRAGESLRAMGQAVQEIAERERFQVIRNLGSHGIGRSLHEEPKFVPSYDEPKETRVFEEGWVLTLEPFLTTGREQVGQAPDGWTLLNATGSLTAQFEHTVVVTRGRPLVLTLP